MSHQHIIEATNRSVMNGKLSVITPTPISNLFRNKAQLLIELHIAICDRLGCCWGDKQLSSYLHLQVVQFASLIVFSSYFADHVWGFFLHCLSSQ